MIKEINGKTFYYDKNQTEIKDGDIIRYYSGNIEVVYATAEGTLGTDATNPLWLKAGRAVPGEYGIYPLYRDETDEAEVIGHVDDKYIIRPEYATEFKRDNPYNRETCVISGKDLYWEAKIERGYNRLFCCPPFTTYTELLGKVEKYSEERLNELFPDTTADS